jgi:hypothetical protein
MVFTPLYATRISYFNTIIPKTRYENVRWSLFDIEFNERITS